MPRHALPLSPHLHPASSHASFQLLKVIEDISKEKLVLEEQLLSLPLVSDSKGIDSSGLLTDSFRLLTSATDSVASPEESSNSRALVRGLQQKLGQVVADFRIQSMKLLETEKSLRELQQDKDIGDRLRIKMETQTENFNHQIALLEERAETLSREIKVWQVRKIFTGRVVASSHSLLFVCGIDSSWRGCS